MTPECQRKLADGLWKYQRSYYRVGRSGLWSCTAWRAGLLFRLGSCWIGVHWSPSNRRLCINLLPFITIWICPPGGVAP